MDGIMKILRCQQILPESVMLFLEEAYKNFKKILDKTVKGQ